MQQRRVTAIAVTAIATLALLSGCGSASNSDAAAPPADAQVRAIVLPGQQLPAPNSNIINGTRLVAQNRARLVAAIRARWQSRAAIVRQVQREQRRVEIDRSQRVVEVVAYSSIDVCGMPERERKQALYYLNLSCPSR